jgi:hypothetical protein
MRDTLLSPTMTIVSNAGLFPGKGVDTIDAWGTHQYVAAKAKSVPVAGLAKEQRVCCATCTKTLKPSLKNSRMKGARPRPFLTV